ncbi:MAG: hypothetical protein JWM16_2964 [Verrucomicrobiales bacterium]|nr:hypothetical protein [Verrucomicrobiales bacterium]
MVSNIQRSCEAPGAVLPRWATAILGLLVLFDAGKCFAQVPLSAPVSLAAQPVTIESTGGSGSFAPVISADGQWVAFVSQAKNFIPKFNPSPYLNVFVRNLGSGQVKMVSASTNNTARGGDADSGYSSVSSNGQFVAFETAARNLNPIATNNLTQVLLRNVAVESSTLVSVDTNGAGPGNGPSFNASISSNGRYVVFESTASNLVTVTTRASTNIYRRDVQMGISSLVSINSAGDGDGGREGESSNPSMSSDGRWVAFFSRATNLVLGVRSFSGEIYVRDMDSGITGCASVGVTNYLPPLSYGCKYPEISADGQVVTFSVTNTSVNLSRIFRFDPATGNLKVIGTNADLKCSPGVSADGRFVSWETISNAFVWDNLLQTNLILTSRWTNNGTTSNALPSIRPVLSPFGSTVAFLSPITNSEFQLFVRQLPAGTNQFISMNRFGEPGADLTATVPSWNWDGSALVFESPDPNTVANDYNGDSDVFYRQISAPTNALVSARAAVGSAVSSTAFGYSVFSGNSLSKDGSRLLIARSDNAGTSSAVQDTNRLMDVFVWDSAAKTNFPVSMEQNQPVMAGAYPYQAALSADGRYAVFVSDSGAVMTGDTNKAADVFWRDLQFGVTALVSVNRSGTNAGNGASFNPSISADGRFVAFQSGAYDLIHTTNYTVYGTNVYRRDMVTGTTLLVSATPSGEPSGGNDSIRPVISQDGRWVVFLSRASDLVTNVSSPYGVYQWYLRDVSNQVTRLVSRIEPGVPFPTNSGSAAFAAGGNILVFSSTNSVYAHDIPQKRTTAICTNCSNASFSGDGAWAAYEAGSSPPRQIVLQNLFTGQTNLVSVDRFGTSGGDQNSASPVLTHDGRYVVFASRATNLVDGDINGFSDIFVRDVRMNATILITQGNGPASRPIVGPDGRTIAFESFASDMVFADFNNNPDFFTFRLNTTDADDDGMDDSWEIAYFGNLARDGKGDYDNDGQSDLAEFRAGTNPADGSSVFHVLSLTWAGGAQSLYWSSIPGRKYRVQYKNSVNDSGWTDLPGDVESTGPTTTKMDDGAGAQQRYYRVLALP